MRNDDFYMSGLKSVILVLMVVGIAMLAGQMSVEAGERCIRLARVSGFETLVNMCASCRNVQINRDRTGVSLPTVRSYQLRPGEKRDLKFKGPGRTRILSDEACNLEAGENQADQKKAQDFEQQCVVPVKTAEGLVLVNSCPTCREIIVQRTYPDGQTNIAPYSFAANEKYILQSNGAIQAQIIGDRPCKP